MPSTFTWLDTSEHDRRRAMEVIDLFRRQNTTDELGVGTIRDSIAELLAPGVSTIQTRARYFLLISWIYQRLEGKRVPSADVARRAREDELRLAAVLKDSADNTGTIGIEAGLGLKRLPSTVYWGGLRKWRILLFPGSQDQYHRSLDRFYLEEDRAKVMRENREAEFLGRGNWHPHTPPAPDDLFEGTSLSLTSDEAEYLAERIQACGQGSLIAWLCQRNEPWEDVSFPWDEPLFSAYPMRLRARLEHARCFSEVMHGAALLYNLMLAEAAPNEARIEEYRKRLAGWRDLIAQRQEALREWDRADFWKVIEHEHASIPHLTREFASRWIQFALDEYVASASLDTPVERELIRERERFLKRGRARLFHREYLQLWGGAAGVDRIDYRWGPAQTIVRDILLGRAGAQRSADAA